MAKCLVFGPVHDQCLGPESRSKEVLVSVSTLAGAAEGVDIWGGAVVKKDNHIHTNTPRPPPIKIGPCL